LFLVLVASPKGRFTEVGDSGAVGLRRSIGTSPFPWRLLVSLTAVGVVLPSVLSPATLLTASATVIFVLMLASLGLLVGLSRQVSLCHAVFAVFGATTLSHLQTAGLPYGLALVLAETVRRPRLGRILRAMADSPVALQSIRVNPTASRVMVFCLSAFLAAVAGGLLGSLIRSMNLASFGFFQSLIWLTVLVAAGASSLGGAVLAALLLVTGPAVFTAKTFAEWQPVAFGLGAMVLAQAPNGLVGYLKLPPIPELAARSRWRLTASRHRSRRPPMAEE